NGVNHQAGDNGGRPQVQQRIVADLALLHQMRHDNIIQPPQRRIRQIDGQQAPDEQHHPEGDYPDGAHQPRERQRVPLHAHSPNGHAEHPVQVEAGPVVIRRVYDLRERHPAARQPAPHVQVQHAAHAAPPAAPAAPPLCCPEPDGAVDSSLGAPACKACRRLASMRTLESRAVRALATTEKDEPPCEKGCDRTSGFEISTRPRDRCSFHTAQRLDRIGLQRHLVSLP
ncbi:unnamed protein product, partial [Mesorhabditis spiculigera]